MKQLRVRGGEVSGPMASVNTGGFRPVTFSFGQIHISGGHGGKALPVNSKTVADPAGNKNTAFVKMSWSEPWLLFATTGQRRYYAGSFGRASLLEDLRQKVQTRCGGEGSSADGAQMLDEDYDPMMDVEQDGGASQGSPGKIKRQGQKRMRYFRNVARDSVVTFDMPARCPEEDAERTEVRQIKLHIVDRKEVWLHIDDVEWAVRYLYVQNL